MFNIVILEGCNNVFDCYREISVEDQEMLSKFLPLLRDYIPDAAEEIESDMSSHPSRQGLFIHFPLL